MGAREIVKARGGDWCGSYGLVPGPGHSVQDRSCKVWQVGDRIFVHSFAGDHWKDCRAHLAIEDDNWHPEHRAARTPRPTPLPARPTARVRDLLRTATSPDLVPDAVEYLSSRKLWPLPKGCRLKAHVAAPYTPHPAPTAATCAKVGSQIGMMRAASSWSSFGKNHHR